MLATEATVNREIRELSKMRGLLARAKDDPALVRDLVDRPAVVLHQEGIDLVSLLKTLWGLSYASDVELLETIDAALEGAIARAGCGHCGGADDDTEGDDDIRSAAFSLSR
jgi:hypothetical protein